MKRYGTFLLLIVVIIWCYAADFVRLVGRWWEDPDYVYGFLVLPFAVWLLWRRRSMAANWQATNGVYAGIALILFAIVMRAASAYISDPVFGPMSLIPCLAGVVLLLGGWGGLHWAWPSIVFLVFMIPLPSFVASLGNLLLQRVATVLSTLVLQTIGIPSVAYGNIIVMTHGQLNVAEACSGLRSTMLFFAVSVGAAFLVKGLPEKITVLLSAVPATVLANVCRIASPGVLHEVVGPEVAGAVFHDLFGFLMLPLASTIVWGEIGLVRHVLVSEEQHGPLPIDD